MAVAVLARQIPPPSESDRIRRRYASLVAPVEPMTTPANVRVVDAKEFTTLAALAHKAGQLVLHWSRGGIETFVVADESTMYRYRIPAASGLRSDSESDHGAVCTPTTAG
jgi:hypothetical protein